MKTLTSLLLALSILISTTAETYACSAGVPPEVGTFEADFLLKKITGYIPEHGGINGKKGQSATPGVAADSLTYEKFMLGDADKVMVAIPQRGTVTYQYRGRTKQKSKHFRSIVRVPEVEQRSGKGKCIPFFAGDHYGEGSNKFGEFGKMDIVHDPPQKNAFLFNDVSDTTVYIMQGADLSRNTRVKPARMPEALGFLQPPPPRTRKAPRTNRTTPRK